MLSLPKELALLCQTKLTLVVAEAVGHDPIKATGLILAHLGRICEQTRADTAQVWRLRTNTRPADNPWELVTRVADRRGESAADLYARERPIEIGSCGRREDESLEPVGEASLDELADGYQDLVAVGEVGRVGCDVAHDLERQATGMVLKQ